MSEDLQEFTEQARMFLDANASRRDPTSTGSWGQGSDEITIPVVSARDREAELVNVAEARRWRALVFDAGFGWLDGPERYGGRGLGPEFARRWLELEASYEVPDPAYTFTGREIIGPVILEYGSQELCDQYLAAVHRGDTILCQLFSEPGAGSDLAALTTRAQRDADGWVISGQKVWTSGAHYSDVGMCIARTSSDGPKHAGLTAFMVDLELPGVDIRPLKQMTGGAEFSEVFLDEVRIDDSQRLGEVGQGWQMALATLMHERASLAEQLLPDDSILMQRLVQLAHHVDRADDAAVQSRLADIWVGLRSLRWTVEGILADVPEGQTPGPELALAKLALTRTLGEVADLAADLLGPQLVTDTGEWGTYAWAELMLGVPGLRIGGGTDEIMRNTVGERVLGLPREPRPVGPGS